MCGSTDGRIVLRGVRRGNEDTGVEEGEVARNVGGVTHVQDVVRSKTPGIFVSFKVMEGLELINYFLRDEGIGVVSYPSVFMFTPIFTSFNGRTSDFVNMNEGSRWGETGGCSKTVVDDIVHRLKET